MPPSLEKMPDDRARMSVDAPEFSFMLRHELRFWNPNLPNK
jgi:hypothetical protein